MHTIDNRDYIVAEIVRDAAAMNDAALADDFDESRFRAQLIVGKGEAAGLVDVVLAAAHLLTILGTVGSTPGDRYGSGMLRIADALDKVGFERI